MMQIQIARIAIDLKRKINQANRERSKQFYSTT